MKSKHLATVLIRLLGFSVCLIAIPNCGSETLAAITYPHPVDDASLRMGVYAIGFGVQAVVAIAVIAMARTIAGWMFKSDEV